MDKIVVEPFKPQAVSSFERTSSHNYSSSSQQYVRHSSSTSRQHKLGSTKTNFVEIDAQPFKREDQRIPTSNPTSVTPQILPPTSTPVRKTNSFFTRLFSFRSSRPKPGYALILSHEKFKDKPPRTGTHHDVKKLQNVFKSFNIETHIKNNLTLAQIKRKVNKLKTTNFSKYQCFIIVILTHGDDRKFYAKDGKYEFIDLIEDPILKANNTLLDLTKIFITHVSCDQIVQTDAAPIHKQSAVIKRNILKCKSIYFDTKLPNGTPFVKYFYGELLERGKTEDLYYIFNAMGNGVITESTMTKPFILGELLQKKTK